MAVFSAVAQSDRRIREEPLVGAGSVGLATARVKYESASEGDAVQERVQGRGSPSVNYS